MKKRTRKEVEKYKNISLGTVADILIVLFPKHKMVRNPKVVGKDKDGLVVEWHYKDVIFTLARAEFENTEGVPFSMYAVQKIEVREEVVNED
jgi:hypothetical protein